MSKSVSRSFLAIKLLQLIKLKSGAQQNTAAFLIKILNENLLNVDQGLFEGLFSILNENKINLNEKERFILNSRPAVELATMAPLVYKAKEGFGFLNAVLAFVMETDELPVDFFNEYTLTLGRSSQGVVQFKNAMIAMVDKSKKLSTKPDVSDDVR